ncbi:MAG: hypothetical protein QUT30_03095 [Acidobacteriota bacterium]|nr:hypothetical protein [Acidobacteriota bacterium]
MKEDLREYPGVALAYPIALESYQWAVKRFDAIDSKIQTMLGLGISFTLAAPIAFSALRLQTHNGWFIAAICLFIFAFAAGIIGRIKGRLMIITPAVLYNDWLHFPEAEFQKNLIFFAGQHLNANIHLIALKQRFLVASTIIFSLEALCLVLSAAFQY